MVYQADPGGANEPSTDNTHFIHKAADGEGASHPARMHWPIPSGVGWSVVTESSVFTPRAWWLNFESSWINRVWPYPTRPRPGRPEWRSFMTSWRPKPRLSLASTSSSWIGHTLARTKESFAQFMGEARAKPLARPCHAHDGAHVQECGNALAARPRPRSLKTGCS